jgi:hypothetical protein
VGIEVMRWGGYLHKDPSVVTIYARAGEKLSIPMKELRKYLEHKSQ